MKTAKQIYDKYTLGWDDYRPLHDVDCIKMMEEYALQFIHPTKCWQCNAL